MVIGANDWERDVKQDVIINVTIEFNAKKACQSDNLNDTVDYKKITKKIIQKVEASNFYLIEKLATAVMSIILENALVKTATVRIDKPGALRFADSVAFELTETRKTKKL